MQEYDAVNDDLNRTAGGRERVIIERDINNLERQISEIERELHELGEPEREQTRVEGSNIRVVRIRKPGKSIFHYLSSRRISSLYDQLPDEADDDDGNTWVIHANIDAPGDRGAIEERLRTYQRQLVVILNYWQKVAPVRRMADVLQRDGGVEEGTYYRCYADFKVEDWDAKDRSIVLRAEIVGFPVRVACSKENFPGLSKGTYEHGYEPNSLMPGFFLGHNPMRLLGYIQCERLDSLSGEIFGGALCFVSNPPEREVKDVL